MSGGCRLLLWFRNDLRLHDNCILNEAAKRVETNEVKDVVPVFCFDPRMFQRSAWGNIKTGPFRAKFLLESVADLKASLREIGSDLVVAVGKPEEILPSRCKR